MVPLLRFVGLRHLMGEFVLGRSAKLVGWGLVLLILALNAVLIFETDGQLGPAGSCDKVYRGVTAIATPCDPPPGRTLRNFSQQSYGAHFAEVGVDADTGEVRLRRMLGVFTAGRILNEKTARSQAIGGMIFGVGAALEEGMTLDPRFGYFVNHDLAEYHVPVHADVPDVDAIFLPELDDKSNPLKSKGVGELGICGAGASLANAIYNACGARVRDYPVTLDKVLSALPIQT
jgi:CO/xanthine dehydrogenase Mo-binding subunit